MLRDARPYVHRDPAARRDAVDEVTIAGAEIENDVFRTHPLAEEIAPQRPPKPCALRIMRQPCVVIPLVHAAHRQSNTIPRIIRRPTVNPRQLLMLPPLLTPTR